MMPVLSLTAYLRHGGIAPGCFCAIRNVMVHGINVEGAPTEVYDTDEVLTTVVGIVPLHSQMKSKIMNGGLRAYAGKRDARTTHDHLILHVPFALVRASPWMDRYEAIMNRVCYTVVQDVEQVSRFRKVL